MKRLQIHGPHGVIYEATVPETATLEAFQGGAFKVSAPGTVFCAGILTTANLIITPIPQEDKPPPSSDEKTTTEYPTPKEG